ncbi:MAG: ABC transporter ATP-binding protein [Ruminococcaceae bacterium]|nr:ABC transporter ATP-binding protein [Oscillospiraceae bacterium]
MSAIKTNNLTKKYKDKTVVNALNLDIKKGEIYALLGVNGAGKSTTIKMLSCLIKPTSGDAEVMGKSIITDENSVKQILSVSPQETSVAPNLTVRENLEFIAGVFGFSKAESREKATKMIEDFDMGDIEKNRAKTLSGGWQRRLSIAMALISKPQVIFLDEPTLGLDVLARRELWKHISKLKGKITIILTTHYLEEAEALSDRIGIMAGGVLKAEGTASELKEKAGTADFEEAFVRIAGVEV